MLNNIAAHLGYAVVPAWRQPGMAQATLTGQLLRHHQVDLVLDVGANAGQYHDFLRLEAGYEGEVVSFEPQPDLAERLNARAAADPRWKVHHLALGSADAELALNVMHRGEFSSFLQPDNTGQPQFADLNRVRQTVAVPVKRLDAIELPASDRLFLKADTQGFDLEVIRGASGILPRVKVIQTEVCVQPIYKGMPRYRDVLAELEGLGFSPAGFFAVSRSADMAAIEFDCLLVRRED
ncbi:MULTISPECIES: FkbM family methyltransferase [Rubrivivax]|uniref:FkbM family methyltransferase n=1 Tax=Rubrivivax TaxID=28067 RepID=UPI001ED911BC|nr:MULTISPECIES: FkbM family methyltransferase [Rubrivivax]